MTRLIPVLLMLLIAACSPSERREPIAVSVIDDERDVLRSALFQGLVALDAGGGIEPALAERWIVMDGGLSYIFRIRDATWSNGADVQASEVVQSLRRTLADRRNSLRPLLGNISSIVAMTGRVIEVRLKRPQPDFLHLLAQTEMGIVHDGAGSGFYRIHSRRDGITRLRPIDLSLFSSEAATNPVPANDIRVRSDPAALAIARFASGQVGMVMGGRLTDLPLVQAAGIPAGRIKVEPARGVFGLYVVNAGGPMKDRSLRQALSTAIDRPALVNRFELEDWPVAVSVFPQQLEGGIVPAALDNLLLDPNERIARARPLVPAGTPTIKVALPTGPGMDIVMASLAADWSKIGVSARRARAGETADLRLIDDVALSNGIAWYLNRLGCGRVQPCDPGSDALLARALETDDPKQRMTLLQQADSVIAAAHFYIPIARPIRWSLVRADLTGWRDSPIANHPLHRLRPMMR
jgi:oligopeptide transport system substrate-binding protein